MLTSIIRTAIRTHLINEGPMTCSDLVRIMGMDPRKHKGTIHALMTEMEQAGILDATRTKSGKRDLWFIVVIRKRDRIAAAVAGI